MSTVVFTRELAPANGWRDYQVDPAQVSCVLQYRAPRVEPGVICQEPTHEGIIYGSAPVADYQLAPWGDGVPPSPQGFYVAGAMFVEGKYQWVFRRLPEGSGEASNLSKRTDGHAVTVFDDPYASPADLTPWKFLASRATADSKKGRSLLGYGRLHWRGIHAWRPIGCIQSEAEYMFSSTSVSGPAYKYTSLTIDKGTREVDGEVAAIGYTSAIGSDLAQFRASLLIRKLAKPPKNPNAGPQALAGSAGGGPVAVAAGAGLLYFLLR